MREGRCGMVVTSWGRRLALSSLCFLAACGGCGEPDPSDDAGAFGDAGDAHDAGADEDAGTDEDAGALPDAGTERDAGHEPDAGEHLVDSGVPTDDDAGPLVDGGEEPDAGEGVDAGDEADAGTDAGSDSGVDAGVDAGPPPECEPGATRDCFDGPLGIVNIGTCAAGLQTCGDDGRFGACEGQVLPTAETCDSLDNDCNGIPDDVPDFDGDGFNACDGDCLEVATGGVLPQYVNPAAFEVPGNGIDDDCDGGVDNVGMCDSELASDASNLSDVARAIELCDATTALEHTPGVLSATLSLADGTGTPVASQVSLRSAFGPLLYPQAGAAMLVLSTGVAATPMQTPGAFQPVDPGTSHNQTSAVPADWFAANGSAIPVPPQCPAITDPGTARDPVMLTLTLRVPSNAVGFEVDGLLLSADFPEYVCSQWVDQFLVLLDSTHPGLPADRSLSAAPSGLPLSASLAVAQGGPFEYCSNGYVGCEGGGAGQMTTSLCADATALVGSGFDAGAYRCGLYQGHGGTGWVRFQGDVVPGEVITVRFALWDSGDHTMDTTVLLDSFKWIAASAP